MIIRPLTHLKLIFLMTIYFGFCLGLTLATANARELSQDEELRLNSSLDTIIVRFQEAIILERELEEEIVVGRALLLLERKKALELSADEESEGLLKFWIERLAEIEWLDSWFVSYTTLTKRTPSRLAYYKLLDAEKADEYLRLSGILHRCLADVVASSGEQSKITEMEKLQREIEFLERNITATLKAQRLTDKEIHKLKDAIYSAFNCLYEKTLIENEIKEETVIGRALLKLEKKKALEIKAQNIDKEVKALGLRGVGRIEWLSEWNAAFLRLTMGTPSRLVYYQKADKEAANDYRTLVTALQKSMIDVIESSGETSNVEAMKEIREKIGKINDSSP